MSNKVLVTGSAGFIGSHVSDQLLSEGYEVVGIDNINSYYNVKLKHNNLRNKLNNPNFKFYKLDLRNIKELKQVFNKHKFSSIIHLAARAGVRPSIAAPQIYETTNMLGTIHLLELARRNSMNNFVFASSSSVYGMAKKVPFKETDPVNHQASQYAVTKRSGELLCSNYNHLYNINTACLRFFTVYGPRGRPDMAPFKFSHKILTNQTIDMYGDGTTARDYTYVKDIVSGITSAMKNNEGYEIYNLGNSNPVKLKKFIETIENAVGKQAKIIQKEIPPGDVLITYADISKAKKKLNYKPKTKLKEGMEHFVEWYKQNNISKYF